LPNLRHLALWRDAGDLQSLRSRCCKPSRRAQRQADDVVLNFLHVFPRDERLHELLCCENSWLIFTALQGVSRAFSEHLLALAVVFIAWSAIVFVVLLQLSCWRLTGFFFEMAAASEALRLGVPLCSCPPAGFARIPPLPRQVKHPSAAPHSQPVSYLADRRA
jgi:hypothetical protein